MTVRLLHEQAIFEEARKAQSPEARQALLDQKCGQDVELKRRVVALLRASEESESFLESPPPGLSSAPGSAESPTIERQIAERPGTVIGPYKLLQQIGEGGMGVVFMAEQSEPIQRTVALKIIKPGMDTRQVIARFEAERQALALMDHPNIAKVLDAGTTDSGRPYFVMELVKGVPITKYCDEKHLSLRERLELLLPVCQAVQHAHQKGVIHRDIKPTNVLVAEYDSHAVPKVIDFGVAKATAQKLTERTMFTEFGQVLGTVEYMSPEQAKLNQLDIDTRSDIYSLGVLLYELLTGSTPFTRKRLNEAAFDEMLRIIREEEPPKPSTRLSTAAELPSIAANRSLEPKKLSGLVKGDLDWVVMKALEKDRNRRYDTASAFAADVQRYLHDEAVQACPPSTMYRFRKFARRNKRALLAASAAIATLLLLVVGLALSNLLIAAERNEKAKALAEKEQALAVAEAQRKRSEANFWQAAVSIRDIITGTALGRENVPLPLRRKFSDQAIKFYQTLLQEDSLDPSLRYETAIGYRTIGMVHSSWREFEQAEESFRKAITILDDISLKYPSVRQYRYQLGFAHLEFSRMLKKAGRSQEANSIVEREIELYEKLLAATPDNYDYVIMLVHFYVDALSGRVGAGGTHEQEDPYRRLSDLLERAANLPLTPSLLGVVANKLSLGYRQRDFAFALRGAGRQEEAEQMFQKAVRTFEKLRTDEPGVAEHWHYLADSHRRVGLVMIDRNKPKEAEQELRQAIQIHDQRLAKFPHEPTIATECAAAYFDLARLLTKAGRQQEAAPLVARGRGIKVEPTIVNEADKLPAQIQFGNLLRDAGDIDQALTTYSEVIATQPDRAEAWIGRGHCYLAKRKFDKATEDFSVAIKLKPDVWEAWSSRGLAFFHRQQWDKAVADYSEAAERAPQVHTNWWHRGRAYLNLAQWDKAVADFTKVLEGWPDEPGGWYWRGVAYAQLNQPDKAVSDLRRAIAIGYDDVEAMKSEPKLDPLRANVDFQKLLTELEEKQK